MDFIQEEKIKLPFKMYASLDMFDNYVYQHQRKTVIRRIVEIQKEQELIPENEKEPYYIELKDQSYEVENCNITIKLPECDEDDLNKIIDIMENVYKKQIKRYHEEFQKL